METFRYGSFETNSSSEHTMTYCSDPRTADELPELAENGNLEIEIKHFWHCGGEGCTTDDLRDIIEYLFMVAANADKTDISREESFEKFEDEIRGLYEYFGKEPPKHVTGYFLDVNDNRHEYKNSSSTHKLPVFVNGLKVVAGCPDETGREVIIGEEYEFLGDAEFQKDFYPAHKDVLDQGVWAKHSIGIACGLCWSSYPYAASRFYDCYKSNDEECTAWDLLTTKSMLHFIHT